MKLGIRLSGGREVVARSEVWLAAVVVALPKPIQDRVVDYVTKPGSAHMLLAALVAHLPDWQKNRVFALVATDGVDKYTPGSYILNAEPEQLSLFSRSEKRLL